MDQKKQNLLVRTGERSGLEEFYSVAIGAFTDEVPAGAGEFTAGFLMVTTPTLLTLFSEVMKKV